MASKDKLLANAQKFLSKGQVSKAISEYQKLVDVAPKDIRNRQKLAELLSRDNRNEDALSQYEEVAKHYTDTGFYLKAIAVFKQMQKIEPSRVDIYHRLAELNEKQGLIGNALTEYRNLVTFYDKNKMHQEAIDVLEKMLALDPDNLNVAAKIAETYKADGLTEIAFEKFQEIIEPLSAKGEHIKVVKLYERFLDVCPDDVSSRLPLAKALVGSGAAEKAIQILKGLLKSAPEDHDVQLCLTDAYVTAEDFSNARLTLKHLLKSKDDDLDLAEYYIRVCIDAGESQGARDRLEDWKDAFFQADRVGILQGFYEELNELLPGDKAIADTLSVIYEAVGETGKLGKLESAGGEESLEVAETADGALADSALDDVETLDMVGEDASPDIEVPSLDADEPEETQEDLPAEKVAAKGIELDLDLELEIAPEPEPVEETPEPPVEESADTEEEEIEVEIDLDDLGELEIELDDDEEESFAVIDEEPVADEAVVEEVAVDEGLESGDLELDIDVESELEEETQVEEVAVEEELEPGDLELDIDVEPEVEEETRVEEVAVEEELESGDLELEVNTESETEEELQLEEVDFSEGLDLGIDVEPATEVVSEGVTESTEKDFELHSEVDPEVVEELEVVEDLEILEELEEVGELEELEELEEIEELDELEELEEVDEAEAPSGFAAALNVDAELEEAEFYLQQGLYDDAERVVQTLLEYRPGLPALEAKLEEISQARQSADEETEATDFVDIMSDLQDDDLLAATDFLDSFGADTEQEDELSQKTVSELDSADTESHFNLGIAYKEMGLYDDAIAEFDKASQDPARVVDCITLSGQCHLEAGNTDAAMETFRSGLQQDSVTAEGLMTLNFELGMLHQMNGHLEEALECFQKVAEKDSFFRDVGDLIKSLRRELNLDDSDDDDGPQGNRDRVSYV